MLGAKLWIFSQFLSPTIEPPVALVSAARQTPSYTNLVNYTESFDNFELETYFVDETTDGGTGLHVLDVGLEAHAAVGKHSLVTETVVVVKATFYGERFHILKVHYFL
jgi:hypothetical protein